MNSTRLYGLIGSALAHSFSAKYFNDKFNTEGLNCKYEIFDLPELPDLNELLASRLNLKGLNVTIPYKREIMKQLHSVQEDAEEIGAVNVIQIINGSLVGYNTDYKAFMENVRPLIDPNDTKALILGSGGASGAVIFALNKMGISCSVVSREKDKADYIYEEVNSEVLNNHNLIVNTTPLGNHPNLNEMPDIPYTALNPQHVLFDLTYNPVITEFMKMGNSAGCKTINGYDMLVRQAELSWEIWNQ